jgi:hypothetical protein
VDVINTTISGVSVLAAIVALVFTWRERRERIAGEDAQRRFSQPALEPKSKSLSGGLAPRLALWSKTGEQRLLLMNVGGSTPSDVEAVLFVSASLAKDDATKSPLLAAGTVGRYWAGRMEVPPIPNDVSEITLRAEVGPLRGEQALVGGWTLFPPPDVEINKWTNEIGPVYPFRLTLSYCDRTGQTLASIFDISRDSDREQFLSRIGPVKVTRSLRQLCEET